MKQWNEWKRAAFVLTNFPHGPNTSEGVKLLEDHGFKAEVYSEKKPLNTGMDPNVEAEQLAGKPVKLPYFFIGDSGDGQFWPQRRCGGIRWLRGVFAEAAAPETPLGGVQPQAVVDQLKRQLQAANDAASEANEESRHRGEQLAKANEMLDEKDRQLAEKDRRIRVQAAAVETGQHNNGKLRRQLGQRMIAYADTRTLLARVHDRLQVLAEHLTGGLPHHELQSALAHLASADDLVRRQSRLDRDEALHRDTGAESQNGQTGAEAATGDGADSGQTGVPAQQVTGERDPVTLFRPVQMDSRGRPHIGEVRDLREIARLTFQPEGGPVSGDILNLLDQTTNKLIMQLEYSPERDWHVVRGNLLAMGDEVRGNAQG